MAAAQLDFEGLFVSLKTQAHAGACGPLYFCYIRMPLTAADAGLAPGHSGGEMTLADATREEMGFIAEHLKARAAGCGGCRVVQECICFFS